MKTAGVVGGALLASTFPASVARAAAAPEAASAGAGINYGTRAHFGILLPSVNTAAEVQATAMLPQGVSFHTTRLKLVGSSREEFLKMASQAEQGAKLVADTRPGLIVFHCTAVSTMDPELENSIVSGIAKATGIQATSTAKALLHALEVLRAKRIVMISPYIEAVNKLETAFFENSKNKLTVLRNVGLGINGGREMFEVPPDRWYELAMANAMPEADAYLISCTNIRSTDVVDALERELGKPVVTSNQAMVWHCLRALGIEDKIPGFGRLLSEY